ncbi:von willebrand domain protein [Podospora conica]|nr:von willebrand domain protein [Schizothecium conicum]
MSHVCGLYYLVPSSGSVPTRRYLPQVSLGVHSHIIGSTSRTALSQNFVNPDKDSPIPELRYTFPLYDGVSVVSFVCTINRTRVIKGVVQERAQARKTYQTAVDRGETAGLLEQLPNASDVFTTTIGNVPAGAEIKVDITYLGELKHDAETDGIRFTLPTSIAPRYGDCPAAELAASSGLDTSAGITIVVDAEVPLGSQIKNVQSPSHPIAVSIGNTSAGAASGADMSLQKASATLSLGTTELGADFVLHVVATNTSNPVAVLETHPTIPNQRALMATLVPKFNLPPSKPEIVFLCDRSGSMSGTNVTNMAAALQVFLKSLPVGVKFNICSFGSNHELLFKKGSRSYDEDALKEATEYVSGFEANFGGTEMLRPLEDIFKRRYKDMNLEVFLLTDGEIWNQKDLFTMMNTYIGESKGAIRVFTLGIGSDVSHSLIEGVARAGNGFAQTVGNNEKMNSKVVRMLKASLTPHVKDYTLEVKYEKLETSVDDDDDFEIIEKVMDALDIDVKEPEVEAKPDSKKPISLFDASANPDAEIVDASLDTSAEGKYSHVPPVAEPKLLQTPFEIPPLFPFNRTSVYLLMSPGSTQRTPKSVILRGTSPSGPLELEIPVTVLPEKGETIHQLAARKAINELEEGRGWLYHAKEATSGAEQGKLLKDRFEGRFSDMVEREAVRLGVTYQVGGKWCSFVAVEESGEEKERTEHVAKVEEKETMTFPTYDYAVDGGAARPLYSAAFALPGGARKGFAAGAAAPRRVHARSAQSSAPRSMFDRFNVSPRPFVAALPDEDSDEDDSCGFGLFDDSVTSTSSAIPPPGNLSSETTSLKSTRAAAPLGAFGRAAARLIRGGGSSEAAAPPPPPPAPMGASFGASPVPLAPGSPKGEKKKAWKLALKKSNNKNSRYDDDDAGMGLLLQARRLKSKKRSPADDGAPSEEAEEFGSDGSVTPPQTLEAALELIVERQTFDGAWKWDAGKLVGLLGLDAAEVLATALLQKSGRQVRIQDIAATAAVLAYLEVKLAGKKDEWEMMAEKAGGWLEEALRQAGITAAVDEFVAEFRGLVV